MSTCMIFDVVVRDQARCQEFMKGVEPALEAAGGGPLARGGALKVGEGDGAPRRIVLLESRMAVTGVCGDHLIGRQRRPDGSVWPVGRSDGQGPTQRRLSFRA